MGLSWEAARGLALTFVPSRGSQTLRQAVGGSEPSPRASGGHGTGRAGRELLIAMCPGTLPASSASSWLAAYMLSVMSLQDWGVPELGLESVKLKGSC